MIEYSDENILLRKLKSAPIDYCEINDNISSEIVSDVVFRKYRCDKIIICCHSSLVLNKVILSFKEKKIDCCRVNNFLDATNKINLSQLTISGDFVYKNILFVNGNKVLDSSYYFDDSIKQKKKKNINIDVAKIDGFSEGDIVVHRHFGIGRFDKLEIIDCDGNPQEFIKILYKNDDVLYVPVQSSNLITKYNGNEDIELDSFKSTANWQKKKQRAASRIKELAEKILKVVAHRSRIVKESIDINDHNKHYQEFVAEFPFKETPGQIQAIDDIICDFASGKLINRLICGDVGFGKTEVAMRATFIATLQNINRKKHKKQIAIIVPTVFLCDQHYINFVERFKNFSNIKIVQINRSLSRKELTLVRQQMLDGEVDVVIGTHSILSDDAIFYDLDLIIYDEEQLFGVEQKEKLKAKYTKAHVITISATPIPRTFQGAMYGLMDFSHIKTPPEGRLSIANRVISMTLKNIQTPVMYELSRHGRVIIVTPKISEILDIKDVIAKIVPEELIGIIHGRNNKDVNDEVIEKFYSGECKVLIATTIIAFGVDFGIANTIIINKADYFGLSQLYQIRGRVGRRSEKAYCYLVIDDLRLAHDEYSERIKIIKNLEKLGSGLSLAGQDLKLRGAGNILGKEQSGSMDEIGIDLYQEMLSEYINDSKEEEFIVDIQTKESLYIPDSYIKSHRVKIDTYRRIANVSSYEDVIEIKAEIIDLFGSSPAVVDNILEVSLLKKFCSNNNINFVKINDEDILISFYDQAKVDGLKIINLMKENKISFKGSNKICMKLDCKKDILFIDKIRNIIKLLKQFCDIIITKS